MLFLRISKNTGENLIYENMPGLQITYNLQDLYLYSRNQGNIVTVNLPFMLCHLQNHTYELRREKKSDGT